MAQAAFACRQPRLYGPLHEPLSNYRWILQVRNCRGSLSSLMMARNFSGSFLLQHLSQGWPTLGTSRRRKTEGRQARTGRTEKEQGRESHVPVLALVPEHTCSPGMTARRPSLREGGRATGSGLGLSPACRLLPPSAPSEVGEGPTARPAQPHTLATGLHHWFSIRVIFHPRGHLTVSGTLWVVTTGEGYYWHLVDKEQGCRTPY